MDRKRIAEETLAAIDRGSYDAPSGEVRQIGELVQRCVEGTQCYSPESLIGIREEVLAQPPTFDRTQFEVINETTLEGCARLVESGQYARIGVLNFASAKHPGGGFLGGAKAQEESLARSSALYPSLLKCPMYYQHNRRLDSGLYSDWMIYSPACPIWRRDDGSWLEMPYTVDFITSPAPNAGAVHANSPADSPKIVPTLVDRSAKVLALAAQWRCEALILGAWGCGVFRNDPAAVADAFWQHLNSQGAYWRRFRYVLFAALDRGEKLGNYAAFRVRFGGFAVSL